MVSRSSIEGVHDGYPLELLRGRLQAMHLAGYSLDALRDMALPEEVYLSTAIDIDRRIPIDLAGHAMTASRVITQDESYGFSEKDSISLGHTQLIWLSSLHRKTLGEVLRDQYELVSDLGSNYGFSMNHMEYSTLCGFRRRGCDCDIPEGLLQRSDLGHLYWWYRVACWFVGELFPLESVALMGADSGTCALAEDLFQCPVEYHQDYYAIQFSNAYLDLPVTRSRKEVNQLVSNFGSACLDVKKASSRSSTALIEAMLRSENNLLMDTAAARFHCSRHTLIRRLKTEGTTFQKIKNRFRMERAQQLLQDNGESIETVSEQLGFSNPPAFTRAFRSWFNVSPSQFRRDRLNSID